MQRTAPANRSAAADPGVGRTSQQDPDVSDENPPISLTFTTSVAEQVAAARTVLWRTVSTWFMFCLFVLLPLVMMAFALAFAERRPNDEWAVLGMLALAAAGAVFWWFFPWYIIWIVRRGLSHPNGPYEIILGDDSVKFQGAAVTAEWKWVAFRRARETGRFFLLYLAKSQAQFIPKRVLSPGQTERIRALVRRQLGNRAQLAGGG